MVFAHYARWSIAQKPYLRTVTAAELREITITSMPAYPESGVEIAHRSLFAQHPELRPTGNNLHRWSELAVVICGGLLVVKSEQRNLSIDDFLALSGVPNTGSGEYVSAGRLNHCLQ